LSCVLRIIHSILAAFGSVSRKSIIFKNLRVIRLKNAGLISDLLARAYLVSSVDNPKGLSAKANPQGLSAKANPQGLSFGSFTSHNTAEVLRQIIQIT
jgi:hypothetical protein